MDWKQINLKKYISEVKRNINVNVSDEIIEKDLLLTFILVEFGKRGLGKELIFKGGTLLSRNYLKYHRFSEDLDFVYLNSNSLRELNRNKREKKIKQFIDSFVPELKNIADSLGLDFSTNRSDTKFYNIRSGRVVYTFKLYYSKIQYIKIEINFIEKIVDPPKIISIKAITDFFDSKNLMQTLNLKLDNFNVLSYSLDEMILEKYRAVLTRSKLQERDLFDLFLIKNSLKINLDEIVEKIRSSSLIKKELTELIKEKLKLLEEGKFFESDEKIEQLAIQLYEESEFEEFKNRIKPILIEICKRFLIKKGFSDLSVQ